MNSIIAFILFIQFHQSLSKGVIKLENSPVSYSEQAPDCRSTIPVSCTPECTGLKVCFSNHLVNVECPKHKPFCDPSTLTCSRIPSTCNDIPIAPYFRCPGNGYYPYALDCRSFWYCGGKEPIAKTCTSGVFDPLKKECSLNILCHNFSYVSGLCAGNENRFVVHPLNPAIHILCQTDFPAVGECPKNTIFNTDLNRCEWQCTTTGMFKDPFKDSCFYKCEPIAYNEWKSDYICCEKGQIFDEVLKTCM